MADKFLLLAAKAGGLLSVACASMLCVKIWYRYVDGPLSIVRYCEGFRTNLNMPSPLPTTLVFR